MDKSDPSPTFNLTLSSRCISEVPLNVATPALPIVTPLPTNNCPPDILTPF